jgi:hypothetical protein
MFGTVIATVVSGVTVLVIGQITRMLVLDPMQEQRKVIGEIDYTLLYTARWWSSRLGKHIDRLPEPTQEALRQTEDVLRQHASRLAATTNMIMAYSVLVRLRWVPSRAAVDEARGLLIGLSNAVLSPSERPREALDDARAIRRLVLLPPSPPGVSI